MRLLLIDDDEFILRCYRRVLSGRGWQVETALGGDAGIQAMVADVFDAVLSDVQMPRTGGPAVYDAALRLGYGPRCVFWSGEWSLAPDFAARLNADGVPRLNKTCLDGEIIVAVESVARQAPRRETA